MTVWIINRNVMNSGDVAPRRRHSGDDSRIPVPNSPILRRSGSQRLSNCFPIAEHTRNGCSTSTYSRSPMLNRHRSLQSLNAPISSCLSPDRDDDLDSVQSFGSNASVTSTMSQCDHASFARNGTTFSSRQKRFVVHCSPSMYPGEEYLTPTQRANRTIRKLKNLLADVQTDVIEKDKEIFKLTKEVVELRLRKAGGNGLDKAEVEDGEPNHCLPPTLSSPRTPSYPQTTAPDDVTSSAAESRPRSHLASPLLSGARDVYDHSDLPFNGGGISPVPISLREVPPSLVDSGHFEDLNSTKEWSSSPHSSPNVSQTHTQPTCDKSQELVSPQPNTLIESLKRLHQDEIRQIRESHTDKVELLLQRITDANDRYYELKPKLEAAELRIHDLENETEALKKAHEESEEHHKSVYLEMYKKGQEAAQFENEVAEANEAIEQKKPSEHEELLEQLDVTRKELENVKNMYRRLVEQRNPVTPNDPEMTLQFLKSAVYYFLTDKENTQGHLQAIESILGFTENEKTNIEKALYWR